MPGPRRQLWSLEREWLWSSIRCVGPSILEAGGMRHNS